MRDDTAFCCWKCGNLLLAATFPLRREEVCTNCGSDLHVCAACEFYNPHVSDGCDEPVAFIVNNKERANFCDYFKYSNSCFKGSAGDSNSQARYELESLFGVSASEKAHAEGFKNSSKELNQLFGLEDS